MEFIANECLCFGDFTLKSGEKTSYYMDLRKLLSNPMELNKLAEVITMHLLAHDVDFDLISSVPYGTISLCTLVSSKMNMPLIMPRKEAKQYGKCRRIEGEYTPGQKVCIIEDVITSAQSLLEMIKVVEEEGLIISKVIVIVDRMSGGKEAIEKAGYGDKLKIFYNIQDIIKYAYCRGNHKNKYPIYKSIKSTTSLKLNIHEKLKATPEDVNVFRHRLMQCMLSKKSGLCVALDIADATRCLEVADIVGPYVCMIKTHIDMWNLNEVYASLRHLRELSRKHGFLIMEDRKFADIGKTTVAQVNRIKEYVDMVTIHGFSLTDDLPKDIGYVVINDMSHDLNPFGDNYGDKLHERINNSSMKNSVVGFVTQNAIPNNLNHTSELYMTPGVNLNAGKNADQNYMSLEEAQSRLTDIIIVGSDIVIGDNEIIKAKVKEYNEKWYKMC